jgi:GT2 family glycosyltransferase
MTLSIIILSYNTKDLLDRCLTSVYTSLQQSPFKSEIIVIDNNSTDGSKELLKKKYPHVVSIFNEQNNGYGKANNYAVNIAKGKYILLLNSDCKVINDGIEKLVEVINTKEKAFIGGKLFNEDRTPQQSCGPFYSLPIVFLMLFLKGDQFNISRYSPNYEREVDWVSGACIIARKKDYLEVGGFDESIFMYMEEIDLLYRAKKSGFHVWFTPTAHFIHTGAASAGNKKQPVINIYKGLVYFYKKHYTQIELTLLIIMLKLKAWSVLLICGIIRNRDLSAVYGKALATLD